MLKIRCMFINTIKKTNFVKKKIQIKYNKYKKNKLIISNHYNSLSLYNNSSNNFNYDTKNISKNVYLSGMLFSNLVVYTIVRDIKDVMLVTSCGAEAIPFMKTWINFPISILMIYYYSWLSNNFSFSNLYRFTYIPISLLYHLLGIFIYPYRDLYQIDSTQLVLTLTNPDIVSNIPSIIFTLIDNWIVALFYTLSNIWGSVVIALLFWSVANQYTNIQEAKKNYPLFGFIANSALVFTGLLINYVSKHYYYNWNLNVQFLMIIASFFSGIHLYFYENLNNEFNVVRNTIKLPKKKISLSEGIKNSLVNPFIRNMLIMISCYGCVISTYETVWKGYMKLYFTNPSNYSQFMGIISCTKGLFTMFMMIISSKLLPNISWKNAAFITPTCLFLLGIIFFGNIFLNDNLYIIAVLGGIISVIAKSCKYSFFDPIKEIAYIPMDEDTKTKGKATVDVLSSPLGKSGSSFLQQLFVIQAGSLFGAIYNFSLMFFFACIIWISTIFKISKYIKN